MGVVRRAAEDRTRSEKSSFARANPSPRGSPSRGSLPGYPSRQVHGAAAKPGSRTKEIGASGSPWAIGTRSSSGRVPCAFVVSLRGRRNLRRRGRSGCLSETPVRLDWACASTASGLRRRHPGRANLSPAGQRWTVISSVRRVEHAEPFSWKDRRRMNSRCPSKICRTGSIYPSQPLPVGQSVCGPGHNLSGN